MKIESVIFIVGGIFSIVCAAMDFDWFMNHSRARFFVKVLTRNGARVFYGIVGIVLCAIGARML